MTNSTLNALLSSPTTIHHPMFLFRCVIRLSAPLADDGPPISGGHPTEGAVRRETPLAVGVKSSEQMTSPVTFPGR